MQLNSGILERRRQNLAAALDHFKLAKQLEPGYCEPDYWIGLTLINMGETPDGLERMELSVGCKYVRADALNTLNKVCVCVCVKLGRTLHVFFLHMVFPHIVCTCVHTLHAGLV